ncbi:uncharacterized protein [Diadema setosum]|uniref:uncharacterized protein n=1 Tax=Diadema setosum TaxID=31175 RepID=UPI003B3A49A2
MATSSCSESANTDDEKDATNPALQMQRVLDTFLQSFLASSATAGGSDGDHINNNIKFCQLLTEVTESFDMHQRAASIAPLQALAGFYCILQTIEAATACFPPSHELLSTVCCRLYECCVCLVLDKDWLKLPAFTVEVVASKFSSLHESLKPWAQDNFLNVALLAKDPLGQEPICKILPAKSILDKIHVDKCLIRQGDFLLERRVKVLLESDHHTAALCLARACSSHPQLCRNPIFCEVTCLLCHSQGDLEGLASQVNQYPSVQHLITVAESLASYCPCTAVLVSRLLLLRLWEEENEDIAGVEKVTCLWVELTWKLCAHDSLQFAEALDSLHRLTDDPLFLYYLARMAFDKVGVGVIPVLVSLCLGALRAPEVHPSEDIVTATSIDLGNVAHYQLLSELLEDDVRTQRLCLLAAFYIAPGPENFASLKENYCSPSHSTGPARLNSWQQQCLIQSVNYFVPGTVALALSEDWPRVEPVFRKHAQKSRLIISEWLLLRGRERAVKLFLKPVVCDEQNGRLLSVQDGKMRWKQLAKGCRKGPVLKAVRHMVPKLPRPEANVDPLQSSSTEKPPACLQEQGEVDDGGESRNVLPAEVITSQSVRPAEAELPQQPACVDSDLTAEMIGKAERVQGDQCAAETEDDASFEMEVDITEEPRRCDGSPTDETLTVTGDGVQRMEVSSGEQAETCRMGVVPLLEAHSDKTPPHKQTDFEKTVQKVVLLKSTSDLQTSCEVQRDPPKKFPGAAVGVGEEKREDNGQHRVALVALKGDNRVSAKQVRKFKLNAAQAMQIKGNGTTFLVVKGNCVLTKIGECQQHVGTENDQLIKSRKDEEIYESRGGKSLSLAAETLKDGPAGHVSGNSNDKFPQSGSVSVMQKCKKTEGHANCRIQVSPGTQGRVEVAVSAGDTDGAKTERYPTPYLSLGARSTEAVSHNNSKSLLVVQTESAGKRCQMASALGSHDHGEGESSACRGSIKKQSHATACPQTLVSRKNKQTQSFAPTGSISGNCQQGAKRCMAKSGGYTQSCQKNCGPGQGKYKKITIAVCPSNLSTSSDCNRRQLQCWSTHNSVPEKHRMQKTNDPAVTALQSSLGSNVNNPSQEHDKERCVRTTEVFEARESMNSAELQKTQSETDSVASKEEVEGKEEGYVQASNGEVPGSGDVCTEEDSQDVSSITDSDSCVWLNVKDSQIECEKGMERSESDVPEAWTLGSEADDGEKGNAVKSGPKGNAHCSPRNSCAGESVKRKSVRLKFRNRETSSVRSGCGKRSNKKSRTCRSKEVKPKDEFVSITMEDHASQRGLAMKVSSRRGISQKRANGVIKCDPTAAGEKRDKESGKPEQQAACTSPVAGQEAKGMSEQDYSGRHRELQQNRLFAVTYNAKEALKKKLSPKVPSRNRKGPGPRTTGPVVLTRCMHAKARIPPPD